MRYSILGFNQALAVQYELTLNDLLLLDYIIRANGNPKMKHIVQDDVSYVWLSHAKLREDLPILNISENTLKHWLSELKSIGFIQSKQITERGLKGSRTYYAITELTLSLLYDDSIRSLKNDIPDDIRCTEKHLTDSIRCTEKHLIDGLGAVKSTSNNKLNLDNKLEYNSISKDIELHCDKSQNSKNCSSLFSNPKDNDTVDENVLVNDENKNSKNETPVKKLTKSNKAFDNAIALVDELFTDDYVKQKLKEYLPIRLSMKDTKGRNTYSFSAWKRQLNKLHTLTDSADERIAIIQQSIDRCYMGFFPVSKRKSYSDRYNIKVISNELDTVHSYKNKGDVMSGEIF